MQTAGVKTSSSLSVRLKFSCPAEAVTGEQIRDMRVLVELKIKQSGTWPLVMLNIFSKTRKTLNQIRAGKGEVQQFPVP